MEFLDHETLRSTAKWLQKQAVVVVFDSFGYAGLWVSFSSE